MRPLLLEVEGFTAFRERTTVDFAGADLFALSGPTGAGKSSVIDAITFALYGSVARYGDRRLVAPLVSQGKVEARVRLDFAVGEDTYRVARVVRANPKGGATTKEARLERLDGEAHEVESLAGDADSVSEAVNRLLGLSFEHFNTCVVLPQGEFARFLHDKPADRQDLLVELLGLGLYDRMRELATQRARKAAVEVELADKQLAELIDATPERRNELDDRVRLLRRLVERIEEAQPKLDELQAEAAAARADAKAQAEKAALVGALSVPPEVHEIGGKLRAVEVEVEQYAKDADTARLALEKAEAAFDPGFDRSALEGALRDHKARDDEAARLLNGEAKQVEARTAEGEAREEVAAAAAALADAEAALEAAKRADLAQALVLALEVGQPCPVCEQTVDHLPERHATPLSEAVVAKDRAFTAHADATTRHGEAVRALDRIEDTLASVRERVSELDQALEGQAPAIAARSQLDAHLRAERDLTNARAGEREARANLDRITASRDLLHERERDLRRRFEAQRDGVAALSPPAAGGERLADDWAALVTWGQEQRPLLEEQVVEAEQRAGAADTERTEMVARIEEYCRSEVGIDLGDREPLVVAVEERATAEARLASLDESLARRAGIEQSRAGAVEADRVARALATHLKADHFERWILDEAHERLLEGATAKLVGLAGGAYSLTVDERRQFAVIDHANADTVRLARTLSGGETFLVSLALALALADQIAELAAGGAVRLESIFLDEGFGSLDPDTLETVATAIEELGAQGRVVGVVTHVRDLAERLPVRFEVGKGPTTSTVQRVEL